jgi:hypothetical protein
VLAALKTCRENENDSARELSIVLPDMLIPIPVRLTGNAACRNPRSTQNFRNGQRAAMIHRRPIVLLVLSKGSDKDHWAEVTRSPNSGKAGKGHFDFICGPLCAFCRPESIPRINHGEPR